MRRSVITPILLDPPHQAPITLAFDSPFVLNRIFVGTCALILADNTGFIHLTLWENRTGTYSRPGPCLRGALAAYELRTPVPTAAASSAATAAGADRRVLGVSRLNCRIL